MKRQIKNKLFNFSIIIIIIFIIVLISFLFLHNKKNIKIVEVINQINKNEKKLESNPINLWAIYTLAKYYYLLAKDNELYYDYFFNQEIPAKFYYKVIYEWSSLGYSTTVLESKIKENEKSDLSFKIFFMNYLSVIFEDLYDKSLIYYRKMLALSEKSLKAKDYYKIGMIYLKKGEYYAYYAIDFFNKAEKNGITSPELYVSKANAYYYLKKLKLSLENYLKAEQNTKFSFVIKYNIATTLFYLKRYNQSIKKLNEIIKHLDYIEASQNKISLTDRDIIDNKIPIISTKSLIKSYNLLGKNYERIKKYDIALFNYRKALKMNDNNVNTLKLIADLNYKLHKYEDALYLYNKINLINPDKTKITEKIKKIKKALE